MNEESLKELKCLYEYMQKAFRCFFDETDRETGIFMLGQAMTELKNFIDQFEVEESDDKVEDSKEQAQ